MKRALVIGYCVISVLQLSTALIEIFEERRDRIQDYLSSFLTGFHWPGILIANGLFGFEFDRGPSPQLYLAVFGSNLLVLLFAYTTAVVVIRFLYDRLQNHFGG